MDYLTLTFKEWKNVCIQANGGIAEEASRLNKEMKVKDKEIKSLEKELQRKEKALAETAAILVLRKKLNTGDRRRGRMTQPGLRKKVVELIAEAVKSGARLSIACEG